MSRIGSIQINWGLDGEIKYSLDFRDNDPEQLFALGGVALTDHLMATLQTDNAIDFCESVLYGLQKSKIEIKPISSELKSANLELHRGNVLYTTFKANIKWFSNNQNLEQALSQMAQNYIGRVLATASKGNSDAIKFGIIGVIASYELHLRTMYFTKQPAMTARANIAKAVGVLVNTFHYHIKSEDLEKHLQDVQSLIISLNMLREKLNGKPFFR